MSLQQMCFGIAGTCALVNLAFELRWDGGKKNSEYHGISFGVVRKTMKNRLKKIVSLAAA